MSAAPSSNNGVSDIFTIVAADGAKATVHSQGGHVTSWVGSAGDERLYLSPAHKFGKGKAIRGGVPIIFPQFSDMGEGSTHGVARSRQWVRIDLENSSPGTGVFEFRIPRDDPQFKGYECRLVLTVTVSDKILKLNARVSDTTADGTSAKDFGFAFHTYFVVSDISKVSLGGFEDGMPYSDNLDNRTMVAASDAKSTTIIDKEIDRIYVGVKKTLTISDFGHKRDLIVGAVNLPDVVLWNPWIEKNARLSDLPQPDGFRHFVCIEHGCLMPRIPFPKPGDAWEGSQVIECRAH